MKGLFIVFEPLNPSSGISKKILAQCVGFKNNGCTMDFFSLKKIEEKWFSTINNNPIKFLGTNKVRKVYNTIFKYDYLCDYIIANHYDFIYIRYIHFANPAFIKFIKKISNVGVKVVLEVPTFPYDDEFKSRNYFARYIIHPIEKCSRKSFRSCVYRIVTVQDYDEILGIPTIKISNAVDIDAISLRNPATTNSINFVAVANLAIWHGYDRLIEGIGAYYEKGGEKDVNFYIIGDNPKLIASYKAIAAKRHIEDKIHFEGTKKGEELDYYFNNASLAIGGLAAHRKGIYEAKALKSVEYAARGIPFIYSDINTDFDHCSFIKRVSQDETPINIEELLTFVKEQKSSPFDIRQYVANNLTWDIQMKKIVNELKRLQ